MFLKPILMLVLFIAIAALGSNYVGDGLFDFQKKAKAARLVEFTRDIATVMQTYKADQASNLSLPYYIDNEIAGADGEGTKGNGVVLTSAVISALKADKLIKGDGVPDFGAILFGKATEGNAGDGDDVVIVNSSDEISNEICAKINEVLGVDGGNGNPTTLGSTAGFTHQYDLSALTLEPSTNPTSVSTADVDAVAAVLPAGSTFLNGGVEGICVEDTGSAQNTFVFYVQEF